MGLRIVPGIKLRARMLKASATYNMRLHPQVFHFMPSFLKPDEKLGFALKFRPWIAPVDPTGRMPPESLAAWNKAFGRA